jgi:hypothetical protein
MSDYSHVICKYYNMINPLFGILPKSLDHGTGCTNSIGDIKFVAPLSQRQFDPPSVNRFKRKAVHRQRGFHELSYIFQALNWQHHAQHLGPYPCMA